MTVILIIVAHFVGDWFLQSRFMATNKSKNLTVLAQHLGIVAVTMAVPALLSLSFFGLLLYVLLHGIQDWYLWRWADKFVDYNKPVLEQKVIYDITALDQALHLTLAVLLIG